MAYIRIYQAEHEALERMTKRMDSIEAAQKLADKIVRHSLFKKLRIKAGRSWSQDGYVTIDLGRQHAGSYAYTEHSGRRVRDRSTGLYYGKIRLGPPYGFTVKVLLHELAHFLVPKRGRSHGREFAHAEMALVRRWMGKEAATLLAASFKKHGIKWRAKRRLKPETLEALRARGKKLAAARATAKLPNVEPEVREEFDRLIRKPGVVYSGPDFLGITKISNRRSSRGRPSENQE